MLAIIPLFMAHESRVTNFAVKHRGWSAPIDKPFSTDGWRMFVVTAKAKEKLKEALHELSADAGEAFRITPFLSMQNDFFLSLDNEREGDRVVESEEGMKVLLIPSGLVSELEGMVLDHQQVTHVAGFTLSRLSFH